MMMIKRVPASLIILFFFNLHLYSQNSSLIVLGDLHYDLIEDHDPEYLKTKSDDRRQVMEYTSITEKHWTDFMTVVKARALTVFPPVKAVIQTGDLSEGLAGTDELAKQMASNAMLAIENTAMPVPWILAKVNHDITGPGAVKAFEEFYVPMIRKQTGNEDVSSAGYSWSYGNVLIVVADPYDRNINIVDFLEKELSSSSAGVKFVVVHEPVIPVTERCWHILRRNPEQREKLLEVIAKNKAIVLCGHLHRYSVVKRNTDFGPVVQLMTVSVVRDRSYQVPDNTITRYGASLAEDKPGWQPETMDERIRMLEEEANHVTFYRQSDLPGYAILRIDDQNNEVKMEYYAAFAAEPFEEINLSGLLEDN